MFRLFNSELVAQDVVAQDVSGLMALPPSLVPTGPLTGSTTDCVWRLLHMSTDNGSAIRRTSH